MGRKVKQPENLKKKKTLKGVNTCYFSMSVKICGK